MTTQDWSTAWVWGEPPLTPAADQAREMLAAELANPIYQESTDPWYLRILNRIIDFLNELAGTSMPSGTIMWIVLAFIVFIVLVIIFAGPLRRNRRSDAPASVFADTVISASQYRDRARDAAASGDFSLASVEMFRAVVKRAEENVLISEQFGRTAREAAVAIGDSDSSLKSEASWGAALFDSVEYGSGTADASDVARLEEFYGSLDTHRTPELVSHTASSVGPPAISDALGSTKGGDSQ